MARVTDIAIALAALLLANGTAFVLCWLDKRAAGRGERRVPERTLLAPVLLGGPLGLLAGMRVFRHKTQKRSFQVKLVLASLVFAAWVAALVVQPWRT
jgi:uncharacterized membrane protein YsdA (DUF1294 family)